MKAIFNKLHLFLHQAVFARLSGYSPYICSQVSSDEIKCAYFALHSNVLSMVHQLFTRNYPFQIVQSDINNRFKWVTNGSSMCSAMCVCVLSVHLKREKNVNKTTAFVKFSKHLLLPYAIHLEFGCRHHHDTTQANDYMCCNQSQRFNESRAHWVCLSTKWWSSSHRQSHTWCSTDESLSGLKPLDSRERNKWANLYSCASFEFEFALN